MLLCGNEQLPFVVFSIYKTGSINKEQEEGLQSTVQGLQVQQKHQTNASTIWSALGNLEVINLHLLTGIRKVYFPDRDAILHPR